MSIDQDTPRRKGPYREPISGTRNLTPRPFKPDRRCDPERMRDSRIRKLLCDPQGRKCWKCKESCGYGRVYMKRKAEGRWMTDEKK